MPTSSPFYISDLPALREKLARAERDDTLMGRLWDSVRRRARLAPDNHPWFAPFVALVTGEQRDLEHGRQALRNYRLALASKQFSSLVHFHFWCAAFPHARWTLYFQWLHSLGAWEPDEAAALGEDLLIFAFTNFFYGLRTKPDPECVDNQGLSLAFCNALVGRLFSTELGDSALAARMAREGFPRIPVMLGSLPASGYSGEGSTYMSSVVGASLPFLVELLQIQHGGDWFSRQLPLSPARSARGEGAGGEASGPTPSAVFRMLARLRLPGGLLLPWDHYGYVLPPHAYLAYAAHRTGDPFYLELLERHSDFAVTMNSGWGYDDAVWTLLWWPEDQHPLSRRERGEGVRQAAPAPPTVSAFRGWSEPDLGAALVSPDASLYLMQMWDPAGVPEPGRAHMNPNALVLSAWNTPLTIDGVPTSDCTRFHFPDTWREVHYMFVGKPARYNFGSGCAGAHSVLLVDGWEGFRPRSAYRQAELVQADAASVTADVTPLYRERWPDTRRVRRRSRLVADRFWLLEDLALFGAEHQVTARWWLRPEVTRAQPGVLLETPEGIRLHLLPLLGPDDPTIETVIGYPDRLDGQSRCVDFTQRGRECRWLWLAFPENTRCEVADLSPDWQAVPDPDGSLDFPAARAALLSTDLRLPFTQPAHLLADVPLSRRWWYRRELLLPGTTGVSPVAPGSAGFQACDQPHTAWLTLPRMMGDPHVWIDGAEVDLSDTYPLRELLPLHLPLPGTTGVSPARGARVEIIVSCEAALDQLEQDMHDMIRGFSGRPALLVPALAPGVTAATYENGLVTVTSGDETWTVPHDLLLIDDI